MKRCVPVLALPALLATAPTPLVVGSVRDQFGAPISGAWVRSGRNAAQTDVRGTFALQAANVRAVTIGCAYCESITVRVVPDEPVVAIVRRYAAIAQSAPTDRDIAFIPYSRGEAIAALTPFTVLEESSQPLPGPQISDRGASPRGALVLDNGIPLYDVATNQSPFVAFPAYAVQRLSWLPPSAAFSYGDLAGGGTASIDTRAPDTWGGVATAGGTEAVRIAQTLQNAAWSASESNARNDDRERVDAFARVPFGDSELDAAAVAAQDRNSTGGQRLDSSGTGAILTYQGVRTTVTSATLSMQNGGYDGAAPALAYGARWSDVQAEGGVQTISRVAFFANAGVRLSTGTYRTSGSAVAPTSGTISQTHVDLGAQTDAERYHLRVGIGAFGFHYAGGSGAARSALDGAIVAPAFSGTYQLTPRWTYELQAGTSFALPTILEAFVYPPDTPALTFDRNTFWEQTIGYGDLRRFRASATSLSERVTGLDVGTIHAAGVSAAWQVAPSLSLRAWVLRENTFTRAYAPVYRFGARPLPATVSSYWLTYESAGVRIDALYRRDLLDYRANPHVDASISAPIAAPWRVFAASERVNGTRTLLIGLRAQP